MQGSELYSMLIAAGNTDHDHQMYNPNTNPNTSTSTSMINMMMYGHGNGTTSVVSSNSSSYNYLPPLSHSHSQSHSHCDDHDIRALTALRNHKEAERRRRERINSHLNKLRNILPCNSKTDKASLLAKVVQRLRELKQQTLEISEHETFPSETDEITVLHLGDYSNDGRLVFKASLCCEDRSDLLSDLTQILKSLHLKTLKAEMATLGGRTRNVIVVVAEKDHSIESVHFLQNALKSLLDRSSSMDRTKRRRASSDHIIMV